jgi:hypothetical protein
MRFPTLARGGAERPIVPVWLQGQSGIRILTDALVDIGADLTLFPTSVARDLEIDLSGVADCPVSSVLGTRATYRPWIITLEFRRPPEIIRWKTTVGFVARRMNYGILGTRGFFEYFDLRYSASQHWLDIEPAGPLPL